MIKVLFTFLVLAGFGFPTWVYIQSDFPVWGIACVFVIIIWILAFYRGRSIYPTAGLVLGMAANAVAIWLHHPQEALILSSLFILAAWDLDRFQRRLLLASAQDDLSGLVQHHLWTLLAFLFCAATLSLLAVWFPLKLSLWAGVILLVIGFVGLVQMSRGLLDVDRTRDRRD